MRYLKWTPYFEPGSREASLEIFDLIRESGGLVDGLHTTIENDIICIISEDVDLNTLDPKWKAHEISLRQVRNILKSKDPNVFFNPNGYPRFPNEELKNQFLGRGVEYI